MGWVGPMNAAQLWDRRQAPYQSQATGHRGGPCVGRAPSPLWRGSLSVFPRRLLGARESGTGGAGSAPSPGHGLAMVVLQVRRTPCVALGSSLRTVPACKASLLAMLQMA